MATVKNALTGHFVGPVADEAATLELAKWISEVNDGTAEEVESVAYYDGDGTPEDNVTSISKPYAFVGLRDKEDVGQNFIAALEFEKGSGRKIWYKQVEDDGTILEGPATVSNVVVRGGAASAFVPFQCTIKWDQTPTVTLPTPPVTP